MTLNDAWILDSIGNKCHMFDMSDDVITIEDIAHTLAQTPRFRGKCRIPYSVGQHSILVSTFLPENIRLAGLMHDAAESVIGDIPTPMKRELGFMRDGKFVSVKEEEKAILQTIFQKLEIDWPDEQGWAKIKEIDTKMMVTEARDLLPPPPADWDHKKKNGFEEFHFQIVPWSFEETKQAFIDTYNVLQTEKSPMYSI